MRGLERGSLAGSPGSRGRAILALAGAGGVLALPAQVFAAGSLNVIPDLRLTAANVIVFLAIIYPTHRFVLRPLLRIMRERVAAVEGTAARAAAVREDALGRRSELEERLATARARAQAERARILGEGEAEGRGLLDAARGEGVAAIDEVRAAVADELAEARSALADEATGLAREAAESVLGRAL